MSADEWPGNWQQEILKLFQEKMDEYMETGDNEYPIPDCIVDNGTSSNPAPGD